MTVSQAVESRRSIRAFTSQPVDRAVLERVLAKAQHAPSGGNLQPWHAQILTGEPLAQLIDAVSAELPRGAMGGDTEYAVYPEGLAEPYRSRRYKVGEDMYAALGVTREDKTGRMIQFARNFRAFDAPVLMLVHFPRFMGSPQWSDVGMWLQTLMLLLREEGLDSCAQEAWSLYHSVIRNTISIPDDHILFCGLSIGYADPSAAINGFAVDRAPLDEVVEFKGF
ncbi:MAG: nitroreductase [Sphingomonadaceae bacterium]|nr:nitroreductase [Sphingomonadaceae bacterium]